MATPPGHLPDGPAQPESFAMSAIRSLLFATAALALVSTSALASDRIVHQRADGQVVAWLPGSGAMQARVIAHAADAVASDCVRLETRDGPRGRRQSSLHNDCRHEVALSWCVADGSGSGGGRPCEEVGSRDTTMTRLAAGARLAVEVDAVEAEIRWVACRGDTEMHSSLIDGGARGECLAPVGEPLVADAAR